MQPEQYGKTVKNLKLQKQLQHVYLIGGGSGAGKSTIARRIAAQCSLHLYGTDDAIRDHSSRLSPDDGPLLTKFREMDMDERWVNRSPKTMLETFHWFQGEGFNLIVEDLVQLPSKPGVIVEGFRLLPHLVKPLLAVPGQAVWLFPRPDFRQAVFKSRESTATAWGFLERTSDPDKALQNLLKRDAMFTDRLYEETKRLELLAIEVDTSMTEEDLMKQVMEAFRL